MSEPISPIPRAILLCDYHIGYEKGKVDLYGIFNTIRPEKGYPYTCGRLGIYSQLINGNGKVPFFINIFEAATDQLIYSTPTNWLVFPNRITMVQLGQSIEGCCFPRKGIYIVELICNNQWLCDTALSMKYVKP